MSRVYVGRLPSRCSERDVERFFRDYGKIREVVLKNGYGFVEFDHYRDAEDAVYDLNGQKLLGERVIIEHAKLPPGRDSRGYSGGYGYSGRGGRFRESRYGPPTRTEHRAIVENLSSRISWQDLKDTMRKAGEVCYADAHRNNRNEGIVEFRSREDLKAAIERFDGYELNGRKLRVFEDRRRRSSSRSSRGSRRRSRRSVSSRSVSRGHSRSRSRSGRRRSHRSRSDRRSRSASHSRSPSRNGKSVSRSKSRSRSISKRSKSRSPMDRGSSRSPMRDHSKSCSRSRSPSNRSRHSGSPRDDRSLSRSRSPSGSPQSDRD